MPDRITIFQGPHERMCRSEADLERAVHQTLWHEIAHYFGMSERYWLDLQARYDGRREEKFPQEIRRRQSLRYAG